MGKQMKRQELEKWQYKERENFAIYNQIWFDLNSYEQQDNSHYEKYSLNYEALRYGQIQVDRARFEVKADGILVPMTLSEFKILEALITHPGFVHTRNRLLDVITGGDGMLVDRNIDVHIRSIRKKLGASRDLILTVRGLGYKFKESEAGRIDLG